MGYNHRIIVLKKRVIKRFDTCLIIPTYKSANIVISTLKALFSKNTRGFDVLLVDNEGWDSLVVSKEFPFINYVVLKYNVGSSGSQYIGQKTAYHAGYNTFIMSDNDAVLLSRNGIKTLVELSNQGYVAVPTPYHSTSVGEEFIQEAPLHYVCINRDILRKVGFVNPDFFLCFDDIEYTQRISSRNFKILRSSTKYYHPVGKPNAFYNCITYFNLRNSLIMCFDNRLKARYRFRAFIVFLRAFAVRVYRSIYDFSVIKTVLIALRDFMWKRLSLDLPENNFIYVSERKKRGVRYFDFNSYVALRPPPNILVRGVDSYEYYERNSRL